MPRWSTLIVAPGWPVPAIPAVVAAPIVGGWIPPFWPSGALPSPGIDSRSAHSDEALAKLASEDPPSAELVKLRFFAGLTNEQAAQALGISERTAKRCWHFGRAWLYRELQKRQEGTSCEQADP
jgi:hypothetical protein